ncbi:SsrA-binding protein SmpB [Auritidibacter ignavus]|uniref:SsrA-binding protein SmpB n=1 Tax=Auritidibacter ignavus TaxID=678932 RepID=UPI00109D240E|nr:SsrA-binding protein SmpB [Auritidibacter ignavus]
MAKKSNGKKTPDPNSQVVASNRKARHNYTIKDTYEAGLSLMGTEVKSLRQGQASIGDGFAQFTNGELYLEQVYIPEYLNGSWTNHASRRRRKLLLHRAELNRLERAVQDKGVTIVPLKLYFKNGIAKVEIAVAEGKRDFDKRQALREQQDAREAQRAMRQANRRGVSALEF